ncbi:hypothetical protein GGR97_002698 [Wenyingzhuangia aestuarii]|nr:hypothetical protein [Wenyingzhuangia aestuarii]
MHKTVQFINFDCCFLKHVKTYLLADLKNSIFAYS